MGGSLKCFLFCIFALFIGTESKYGYVTWVGNKAEITVTDYFADIPDVHVAKATYSNEINSTGWAFLELHTSGDSSDEQQAYAAGYLEGFLTRDLIWMHWQNVLKGYCYNKTDVCGLIEEFVDKNEAYIASMVSQHPNDAYWYQMKLYYIQLEGLAIGYNEATSDPYQLLTVRDIIWINMLGDLDELAFALTMPPETPEGFLFPEHCSGLVKLLPDLSDLYVSQVTWNSYQSMLRFQKMYVLKYRIAPGSNELIPGYKMSLSSYPAFVQSTDDFYILSSGLVAAETTIGNSNRTLFRHVHPVGQVLEYARAMVANRLARSGADWVQLFRKHNSGTYNNQWYIVDYKKFKPRTSRAAGVIKPGLLWVVEQLPGYTEAADLTSLLRRSSYFPSYNIAYFPRVFNLSGGQVRVDTYGDWFGYHTNPRAKMFKQKQRNRGPGLLRRSSYFPSYNIAYFPRVFNLSGGQVRVDTYGDWFGYHTNPRARMFKQKQADINNLKDMYDTMRYNDFKHDPLARCSQCSPPYSGCNAISARNDLNPAGGTYPFRALGHRSHGATDAKITSAGLRPAYQFIAVASPTHNISRGIPPFAHERRPAPRLPVHRRRQPHLQHIPGHPALRVSHNDSHGATDAKITSAGLRPAYQFIAVASPTYNISRGIPPFAWSDFDLGPTISHVGHPDRWMFPPLLHRWEWE